MSFDPRLDQTTRPLTGTVRLTGGAWEDVPTATTRRQDDRTDGNPTLVGSSLTARLERRRIDGSAAAGIGRYEVKNRLGSGATAAVWAVFDRSLQRPLAAKVLAQFDGDGMR